MSGTAELRDIIITRTYDAPRAEVWKAWTEPARIAAWWGKRGWRTPVESVTLDVRPGGVFRLNSIADADGSEMPVDTIYHEVVPPERLSFGGQPGGRRATVTFRDLGGGRTEMTFTSSIHADAELHARALGGLTSAFDRLAEQLPRPRPEGTFR